MGCMHWCSGLGCKLGRRGADAAQLVGTVVVTVLLVQCVVMLCVHECACPVLCVCVRAG